MKIWGGKIGMEQVLLRGIAANLQDQVVKRMVDEEVARFRASIEAAVRSEVEKYTIDSVERFMDMHAMAEKLGLVFEYKEVREAVA